MRLTIPDIINREKSKPTIITLHGPSLTEKIKRQTMFLQKKKGFLRFSINDWFNFLPLPPSYWVMANSSFTIASAKLLANCYSIPVFFADSVDLNNLEIVDKVVKSDYLNYDQRHFKGRTCAEIINSFLHHQDDNPGKDFKEYGNNSIQWNSKRTHPGALAGFSKSGCCCHRIIPKRLTIQEELQKHTGYEFQYSTGDTAALHLIAFAILMGCDPIYITGLDLDYSKGYSSEAIEYDALPPSWKYDDNLKNDLTILSESAKLVGIEIINLTFSPWYGKIFKPGVFK